MGMGMGRAVCRGLKEGSHAGEFVEDEWCMHTQGEV